MVCGRCVCVCDDCGGGGGGCIISTCVESCREDKLYYHYIL